MPSAAPRFSYLGPAGTFTYSALLQVIPEGAQEIPALDVPSALRMVRHGDADFAVVPIENSVEGGVNATLDALVAGSPLEIKAEMLVPITFALAVRPGTKLNDIHRVATHPHAWAQCREWIHTHIGDCVHVPATSTAAGATLLAQSNDPGFEAALCPPATVTMLGLEALSTEVADNPDAVTRFIMVGRPGKQPERTGSDKTTLMIQLPHDEAGALLDMLEQFSARGVSLSRIESRPVGDALGRYAFSLDTEGHLRDERIQSVLAGLYRVCPKVIFLGSYPAVTGKKIRLQPGTTDAEYRAGQEFVQSLLDRA